MRASRVSTVPPVHDCRVRARPTNPLTRWGGLAAQPGLDTEQAGGGDDPPQHPQQVGGQVEGAGESPTLQVDQQQAQLPAHQRLPQQGGPPPPASIPPMEPTMRPVSTRAANSTSAGRGQSQGHTQQGPGADDPGEAAASDTTPAVRA